MSSTLSSGASFRGLIRLRTAVLLAWILLAASETARAIPQNTLQNTPISVASAPSDTLDMALAIFYKGDWQRARTLFDLAAQAHPQDPRPVFFSSMIPFWDYFFVSRTPERAAEYLKASKRAIEMSEARLERAPDDSTMVLLLSGLHGYRSLVAAGERMHMKALRSGVTGFGYTRRLLALGEERADVRIGKGMYHYMVGSVPSELNWALRLLNVEPGSVEQGFRELELAAGDTTHFGTEARMILAYLHRKEGNLAQALRHLDDLLADYPANPIFHYLRADVLERGGRLDSAREAYALVLSFDNPAMAPLQARSRERLRAASPAVSSLIH